MPAHILIVDDDVLLRYSLGYSLRCAGYETTLAETTEEAFDSIHRDVPDIILLDIGIPEMNGLEAIHQIHEVTAVPIIFLTAKRRELDEIRGLEAGADDYVTKPFDTDVLLAHIRAVLRRTYRPSPLQHHRVIVGGLEIDSLSHTASLNQRPLELSPKEFDLLFTLAQEAGRVISVDDLLKRVWGEQWIGESQTVYVHMRWLREKIEQNPQRPKHLLTVRGVGYKLVA